MAITFNSAGSGVSVTNPLTFAHTVASGSNKAMIVGVCEEYSATTTATVSSVTYDGNALTFISRERYDGDKNFVELWYLATDASITEGENNIVVTISDDTNMDNIQAGVIVIDGVAQQAPEAENSAVSNSVTVTTVTNDAWVVDVASNASSGADMTAQGTQVERYELSSQCRGNGSTDAVATAGDHVMSWQNNNAVVICAAAFEEYSVVSELNVSTSECE